MNAMLETKVDAWRGRVDEPLYFSSGEHSLFAWLHLPEIKPSADLGLLVCKPFGYEALCAHRSIRTFAEMAAGAGLPAMRFDYLGSGDSEDIDPDADQITAWVTDILAAAAELRQRTGVTRICLLGIRLGALLAAMATSRCEGVVGLVSIAPVVSGKKYLRELRATQLAGPEDEAPAIVGASSDSAPTNPGSLEFSGYTMSAATMETLSRLDITRFNVPTNVQVLTIDRSDLPNARAWSDALTALGNPVQYLALPGLVDMALVAPQFSVVPQFMLAATRDWLPRLWGAAPSDACHPSASATPIVIPASAVVSLPGSTDRPGIIASERPVCFGSSSNIFGIVTEPPQNELRRRAVILLNAGVDYHMGASRMYVTLARLWAQHGYYVLRLDLSGIGDSRTLPDRPDNEVYTPSAIEDMRAAIDFMRSRYAIRDMTLAGLCSGAYHALRGATSGLPVDRILVVNPMTFYWKPGMSLKEDVQIAEVIRNPGVYRERVMNRNAWRRLFTGRVNIWRIVKIYVRRPLLALESAARDLARRLRIKLPEDLGWELEELVSRGIRLVFVFSRGEPGLELLRIQGGSSVRKLGRRCRVRIIENADHTFTRRGPRAAIEQVLSDELFSRKDADSPTSGKEAISWLQPNPRA